MTGTQRKNNGKGGGSKVETSGYDTTRSVVKEKKRTNINRYQKQRALTLHIGRQAAIVAMDVGMDWQEAAVTVRKYYI
jgi:hypothetical protein